MQAPQSKEYTIATAALFYTHNNSQPHVNINELTLPKSGFIRVKNNAEGYYSMRAYLQTHWEHQLMECLSKHTNLQDSEHENT
jgi:hypothetical protein